MLGNGLTRCQDCCPVESNLQSLHTVATIWLSSMWWAKQNSDPSGWEEKSDEEQQAKVKKDIATTLKKAKGGIGTNFLKRNAESPGKKTSTH